MGKTYVAFMLLAKYGCLAAIFGHDIGQRFKIVRGPTLKKLLHKHKKGRDLILWHCLPNVMHYIEEKIIIIENICDNS